MITSGKKWKLLFILPFTCICCALSAAGAMDGNGLGSFQEPSGYGDGPGQGEVPARGNCANLGVNFPDDPFHGWPVEYERGNWGTVTFWFCDLYSNGTPHWGIDLGGAIEGKAILATTERGTVRQAVACPSSDPCWNYGMGNFLQVEAQIRVQEYERCVAEHAGDPETEDCWLNSGWLATYMHLKDINVVVGQVVHEGERLGHVGNSGNSTGSHLHYQITSPASGAVDPALGMQ
jgi:murein DD-endopeptidase MepM/ murein hydrolase activator NlpD